MTRKDNITATMERVRWSISGSNIRQAGKLKKAFNCGSRTG